MPSKLFNKTKTEVENLDNVNFSDSDWEWYLENGIDKRCSELSKENHVEPHIIRAYAHTKRSRNIIKTALTNYKDSLKLDK
jgi:hypothetical protein